MSEPKLPPDFIEGPYVSNLFCLLGLKNPISKDFLIVALENAVLFDQKQSDYGPNNITKGGIFGCILRSSDKFERLFHLFNNRRRKTVNESIRDSFRDIANYMTIAILLDSGKWPKE